MLIEAFFTRTKTCVDLSHLLSKGGVPNYGLGISKSLSLILLS